MKSYKILSTCCFLCLFLSLYGCSTGEYTIPPQQLQGAFEMKIAETTPYRIQSLDVIMIEFPMTPKHSQEITVRPDGSIILDVAGDIIAAGLTPSELAESIKKLSSRRLRNPEVEITLVKSSQKVYVGGEVGSEGVVPYYHGLTVIQAIFERGGFRDTADSNQLFLARVTGDKMNIITLKTADVVSLVVSPNDVIYIPKTGVAKTIVAVRQYIKQMVPINIGYGL